MMNDRLRKAMVALLAVATIGACDDAPVDVAPGDAARLSTNPSFVTIEAGGSRSVLASLLNELGNPVQGEVSFSACNDLITVDEDENQSELEAGTKFIVTGVTLGESCVEVEGAGFTDTVRVVIVPDAIVATSAPDTVRAGSTGGIDVELRNANGQLVGPFAEEDATFTSSDTLRLFFTDDVGGFDTRIAGGVNVTVAHSAFGVTRTVPVGITVIPAEPDSARLSATTFGAVGAGDTTVRTIIVLDSIGNVNRLPQDLLTITATSDNNSIATATAAMELDPARPGGDVIPTIRVAGQTAGQTTIDITLTTVSETFTFNNVPVTVLAPNLAALTPDEGRPGQVVVISGVGLQEAGFTTAVFMEGTNITSFVDATTPTAITLDIPAHASNGDKEIWVTVGGVPSDTLIWTQTSTQDVHGPANESAATAPTVTFPIDLVGTFQGANDNDWYRFTLATRSTLTFRLDWTGSKDLDVLFRNATDTGYVCSFGGATTNHPENATCTMNAGTYLINVNDYSNSHDGDTSLVTYELRGTAVAAP